MFMFGYISLCKTRDQRVGPFLNQATFHKDGKGLPDDNSYQIARLFACSGSDKRQCKDCWGGAFLVTGPYFHNLAEVHWQMLYTKYQSSRSRGFRQKKMFIVSLSMPM